MTASLTHENKLGIITGASRGIGAAVARRLAAKGCNLLLTYSSASSVNVIESLCRELSASHNIHCSHIAADLLSPEEACQEILRAAKELFTAYNPNGHFQVDVLVKNAGVSSNQHLNDGKVGAIGPPEFDRVYTVNVLAPLLLTQTIAPFLPTDRSGRIVSVLIVSSSIGYQGQSVYAGSKAAIEAMTRVWSRELSERATVNVINPGPVWEICPYVDATPLVSYHGEEHVLAMAGQDADKFDAIVKGPMRGRRPGFTNEVAGTVDMLCSPESGWTTGSVICANGGMKMSIA
ncbi:hypothetical protein PFICI_13894 [Pestalotiopsis fici W106-1]|uniref:Uncharacterized protein n=1 Tax=Pestalotiopsis fici (strain W106-1 / CGMCC3.15140) TaxID=1229662 RepID=W3WJH1_PESFW|nr:uncharacterized protein PFICI_13894 [Pestalotiopsis fici W106-1]ETS74028.1 hypothetical protein PFICI_13894 [Pestalotiopsis fici W106-1]